MTIDGRQSTVDARWTSMTMTATRAVYACTKLLNERKRTPCVAPQVEEAVR
jgi:hypothetical protein